MNMSLSTTELKQYLAKQLENLFPDNYKFSGEDVDSALDTALQRTEYCFKYVALSHYNRDGQVWFSHLHSDQYSTFLYFMANSLWKQSENRPICDKLVMLNKCLNALFISYKCDMPNIFILDHPVGTVLGNAIYSDFLVVLQNVTVNTTHRGCLPPVIGKGVFLSAGACIVGDKGVGNCCSIGANTLIYYKEIPDNSVAFKNAQGELTIKENKKECLAQVVFNTKIMG